MTLKPYPKYKDSGVESLGDVPHHWQTKPLKFMASINDEVLTENVDPDYDLNYVDIGSVSLTSGIEKIETFNFKDAPSRARRIVRHGDIIVSTVRTYLKAIAPINNPPDNLIVSTGFAVVRAGQDLSSRFASFLLQSTGFVDEIISRSTGVSYPAINATDLARIKIPRPPSPEQSAIATFLDHETGKIDALIAEQEKLITLLAEKRQATISHAVTKGLNPDVRMKDSCVEWLGEVPEGWEVKRLKFLIVSIESGTSVNSADIPAIAEEFGILKTSCVYDGEFRASENKTVLIEEYKRVNCPVKINHLIVSRMNTPDLVGAIGLVREEYKNIFLPDRLWQIGLLSKMPAFVHFWSRTRIYRSQVEMVCTGASSSMQNLSQGQFGDFIISYPSDTIEQQLIIDFLDQETTKLDSLTAEANRVIDLLKERRTALISAAVTGKIDVRGVVQAEQVAA